MSESLTTEIERRQTNRDAVAIYFKAHPCEWIEAFELEKIGGQYAWRTRVSEARKQLGMYIQNRQDRGHRTVRSYYRYLPQEPLGRAADIPDPEPVSRPLFSLRP